MTIDRWWISTSKLRAMRYLGWYSGPGGKRHRAPWITDDGDLEPNVLITSELFQGDDVEAATDFLSIPSDVCARTDLIASYLHQHGWNWLPDGPEPTATPAWAARTVTNAYFWLNRDGLLVDFGHFPRFDAEKNCWLGSPLWAAFLLACWVPGWWIPPFPPETPELWSGPLEYLSEQRPWLADDASRASKMLEQHFLAFRRQHRNREVRKPVRLKIKEGNGNIDGT